MDNCIFCAIAAAKAKAWRIMENEYCCAFLDIFPASKYHTLVIPKKHYVNIYDIPAAELKEVIAMTQAVAKLYEQKLGLKNIQILSNNGAAAGQEVFHSHFHIIPRGSATQTVLRNKSMNEKSLAFDEMIKALS